MMPHILRKKPQALNQTFYQMLLQCNHQEKLWIFNSGLSDSQEQADDNVGLI